MTYSLPTDLRAGDTYTWTEDTPDYLPAEGWTFKYQLRSASAVITLTSAASGLLHAFTVAAVTSAAWAAGHYEVVAYVVKASTTEQVTLWNGHVEIKENLSAATEASDGRLFAQKMVDAYEAVLLGRATQQQHSMVFGNRSAELLTPKQLRIERSEWLRDLRIQQRAENQKRGGKTGRQILAHIHSPS